MKNKINLTTLLLVLCFSCFGQKQRMAILPTSMNYGSGPGLKSICIDYLRDGPGFGEAYNNVLSFDPIDKDLIESFSNGNKVEGYDGNVEMKITNSEEKDFVPAKINKPFIVGNKSEQIGDRYLSFIKMKIESYQKSNFDIIKHSELQDEIWQYNVLDVLGYLKNEGDILTDFENGKNNFYQDFTKGEKDGSQILQLANDLKKYDKVNLTQEDGYVALFIRKTNISNEYIVFRGAQEPIYRGKDEIELANRIEKTSNKNDNVHLFLENFESEDKEDAFMSTLRIYLKTKSSKLGLTKVPKNGIADLLSNKVIDLKLSTPLAKESITEINYNSKDYFKTTIAFENKSSFYPIKSKVDALSTKRTIIETLIDRTTQLFKSLTTDISLKLFFNNFKKELKQTMKIENDDEFIIILKNEFKDVRIVKIAGDENLYLTMD